MPKRKCGSMENTAAPPPFIHRSRKEMEELLTSLLPTSSFPPGIIDLVLVYMREIRVLLFQRGNVREFGIVAHNIIENCPMGTHRFTSVVNPAKRASTARKSDYSKRRKSTATTRGDALRPNWWFFAQEPCPDTRADSNLQPLLDMHVTQPGLLVCRFAHDKCSVRTLSDPMQVATDQTSAVKLNVTSVHRTALDLVMPRGLYRRIWRLSTVYLLVNDRPSCRYIVWNQEQQSVLYESTHPLGAGVSRLYSGHPDFLAWKVYGPGTRPGRIHVYSLVLKRECPGWGVDDIPSGLVTSCLTVQRQSSTDKQDLSGSDARAYLMTVNHTQTGPHTRLVHASVRKLEDATLVTDCTLRLSGHVTMYVKSDHYLVCLSTHHLSQKCENVPDRLSKDHLRTCPYAYSRYRQWDIRKGPAPSFDQSLDDFCYTPLSLNAATPLTPREMSDCTLKSAVTACGGSSGLHFLCQIDFPIQSSLLPVAKCSRHILSLRYLLLEFQCWSMSDPFADGPDGADGAEAVAPYCSFFLIDSQTQRTSFQFTLPKCRNSIDYWKCISYDTY